MEENGTGTVIVDRGVPVHQALGPGLPETMREDFLLTFGEALMRNGMARIINGDFHTSFPPCLRASVRNPKSNKPWVATGDHAAS